jgi:hypothetical protein
MSQSAITAYLHQPLYIHGNGFAQIAFNHSVTLYNIADVYGFFLRQVLDFGVNVYSGFLTYLRCPAFADAKNVRKPDLNPFIDRQIHSCDSSQFLPPSLTLTLLVLRVGAPNLNNSLAAHDLTFSAYLFDGCPYLHNTIPA